MDVLFISLGYLVVCTLLGFCILKFTMKEIEKSDAKFDAKFEKLKAIQESLDFLKQVNDEIQRVQLENEELRSQNRALRQANSHSVEFMKEEGLTSEK
ncbi:hypothetical protein EA79_02770 [Enterococcus faecalis]|uniref:hypothetical protein n=1 Tax=Enterococcus faecalis TaxID=1351 RepID=UPI000DEAF1DB|nr:hypothetical protein [Enterococcus faecalis]RBR98009.1 hypothetical protein EA79_02770 [Enterococcus faecalis]